MLTSSSEPDAFIMQGSREYKRATFALFCAGFATFALLYCVQPLLPQLAIYFSITAANSSLALSVTTFSLAAGLLISGALSESWGRKRVMVVALIGACTLGLSTAWVTNWHVLLVLRTLLGIMLSGLPALAMAYIVEEFDPSSLSVAMGTYISGTALGGLLGRLVTGILSDWAGWQVALGGIATLALIACGLFIWLLPASKHFFAQPLSLKAVVQNYVQHIANKQLRILFWLPFLLMGSFVALFNYIGFYLSQAPFDLSSSVIGFLFLVYLLGIWSSNIAGKLVAKKGARPVLLSAIGVMLLGALLCLTFQLSVIIIGLALFTAGFFGAHSVASGLVGRTATKARAQASALYLSFYYLGSSVLGYAIGWFWLHGSWQWVVGVISIILLVAYRQAQLITK